MREEKNEAKQKNELLKSLLYRKKTENNKDWIIKDIWNLFDAKEEKEKKRDYGN